jgi:UDP-glucose 4-epimerase
MMYWLVTGAGGFIGSHVFSELIKKDKVGIVRDIPSRLSGTYAIGDLRNRDFVDRVFHEYRPELVIHTAAQSIVSSSFTYPQETYSSNVMGMVNIIEGCKKANAKLIHLSTDKVLGEGLRKKENERPNYNFAGGPYILSKIMQEILVEQSGLQYIILRSCNAYGPEDNNPRIIPNMVREALTKGAITVFKENEPSIRQYVYISDLVRAIIACTKFVDHEWKMVYHVGTPDIKTQMQVAKTISKYTGAEIVEVRDTRKIIEIKKQSLDYELLVSRGWRPTVDFNTGIMETVAYWKQELGK